MDLVGYLKKSKNKYKTLIHVYQDEVGLFQF